MCACVCVHASASEGLRGCVCARVTVVCERVPRALVRARLSPLTWHWMLPSVSSHRTICTIIGSDDTVCTETFPYSWRRRLRQARLKRRLLQRLCGYLRLLLPRRSLHHSAVSASSLHLRKERRMRRMVGAQLIGRVDARAAAVRACEAGRGLTVDASGSLTAAVSGVGRRCRIVCGCALSS